MITLIAVSVLGLLCLVLEILGWRKILVPVTVVLLSALLGVVLFELYSGQPLAGNSPYDMIRVTPVSLGFSALFILLTILLLIMSPRFYENQLVKIADYVAIKVFLLAGAIAMIMFGNLAMFFLGLEVLSVAGYILASSSPRDLRSNEAGMKYFIMGAFASSFTLLGITLIYGATGSFDAFDISAFALTSPGSIWFQSGMVLMGVGLFFKASIVPFHFWAPDVYEGSPTLTTALMSTLVRVAAIAALYKMLVIFIPAMTVPFQHLLVVLAILTLTVGNVTALRQKNVKRMMAYSGISHTGFMMMAFLHPDTSFSTILYYAAAYSLAGVAAFAVILSVCRGKTDEDISHFYGLARKQPVLAFIFSCALLSMGGLPVFAGFLAKLFVFQQSGNLLLIIFGIINTVIAVYYYVRVINGMYTKERESEEIVTAPVEYLAVGVVAMALNVLLGIFPSVIMG